MDGLPVKNFPPDCRLNGITPKGGFQLVKKAKSGKVHIPQRLSLLQNQCKALLCSALQ